MFDDRFRSRLSSIFCCIVVVTVIASISPAQAAGKESDHPATLHRAKPTMRFFKMADDGPTSAVPAYVGTVKCPGQKEGTFRIASGWLVGATDIIITTAHTFSYDQGTPEHLRQGLPSSCTFVLRDNNGQIIDTIPIRYAASEWAKNAHARSNDFAVAKLDRSPLQKVDLPTIAATVKVEQGVQLFSVQLAEKSRQRPVAEAGRIRKFSANLTCSPDLCAGVTDSMFISSANSVGGSSGGAYVNYSGEVVGLHVGSWCRDPLTPVFSDTCFNFGIYLDTSVLSLVNSIRLNRVDPTLLIR